MDSFFHQQHGVLVAPNKCGSTTLWSTIPRDQLITKFTPVHFANGINWDAVVRDPVAFYVSGYRYSAGHMFEEAILMDYDPVSFEHHLEYCIGRRHRSDLIDYRNQFDTHTWLDPVSHIELLMKNNDSDISRINNFIKLEDATTYNQACDNFSGGKKMTIDNVTSIKAYEDQYRHNRFIDYPVLNDRSISLLRELDIWSHRVGYNLNESIENYNAINRK
tara:strand:- start:5285 stop:5941 length:657 start_codon:yes stop_codon:yes gene_type:complete